MSLSPATIQSTVEAALLASLGALSPAWQLSRLTWHQFPGADPAGVEALAFAVGLPSCRRPAARSTGPSPGRQSRGAHHAPAVTTVGLRMASRIRADAAVEDYRTALAREADLIGTACSIGEVPLVWDSTTRSVVGDGTVFVADVLLTCLHYYPIVGV